MRPKLLLAALAAALLPALAAAQCPGGLCYAPAFAPAPSYVLEVPRADGWHADGSGGWGLFAGGVQIGHWRPGEGFRPYDGRGFGEASPRLPAGAPPLPDGGGEPAAGAPADVPDAANFGVDETKLRAHGSKGKTYSVNGRPVTQAEAKTALAGEGVLADDAATPHLTLVGSAEECKQVLDDLAKHPALAGEKGKWHVHDFRPDHPLVAGAGFVPGKPAVYLQAPDGKVLGRSAEYSGPEQLAQALRKKHPAYDAAKDPGLSPGGGGLSVDLSKIPPSTWGFAALAGLLLFGKQSKGNQ